MTTKPKRIEKLLYEKESRFSEIKTVLNSAGYKLIRIKGSHHIFKHENENILVFPVHNNIVKRCYTKEILKKINQINDEKMPI